MSIRRDDAIEEAIRVAKRLRAVLHEAQIDNFNRLDEPWGNGDWLALPDPNASERSWRLPKLDEVVGVLNRILTETGYETQRRYSLSEGEFWSLGSQVIYFPIRAIHGGFVEPVRRIPIISHVPDSLVAFFLEIPGERDLLKRERHNQVGWHYHYLDFKKARSNIVLSWDTRALRVCGSDHPLFQETHAEGRADFRARPDRWGSSKKRSMHRACAPDLDKWSLNTFRCASKEANPVWPLSAMLTARPNR
jgi:hypothetical protein